MKGSVFMHRVLNIATCSLFSFLLLSCVTAIAGPKLICEKSLYDFGEREVGQSVEHTFIVKNVGDAPAEMKNFKPQCGCAVLHTTQDMIAPGEEAAVTLKVSLGKNRGPYRKSLTIVSDVDRQEHLKLAFEGVVTSDLYVIPERINLGSIDADKEVTRSVLVVFAQEEPVKITRVMSDVDAMVSAVKTLKEGGLYRVTVRVQPTKCSSRIQSRVLLYTDSTKYPMVDIPVIATVVGDLAVIPNGILLTGDPKVSVTRYIIIRSPKGKSFKIQEVRCPKESVKAEVKTIGAAGYRIELSGLTATSDLNGKSVLVITDLCSIPVLKIPLHVKHPSGCKKEPQVQDPPRKTQRSVEGAFRLEWPNVDRGKVLIGKPLEHRFRLFNTSNETRRILKVTPGCSCAKVVRFSESVAPKAWGDVVISLDTTGGLGLRQSSVLIETDDPILPHLNPLLSCQVLPTVVTEPPQLMFTPQGTSGFPTQTVEVVGLHQDEKMALGDIETSDPRISITKEEVDEPRRFRLAVAISNDMPAGVTLAHLMIKVDGSAQKTVWFPMTIANEVKMKAEPSGFTFSINKDTVQTAEFTIKTLDNSPLKVNKVELVGKELHAVTQQTANNTVLVRLKDLKVTRNLNLAHIRVLTNHGELRVPISVSVHTNKGICTSCSSAS